MKVSRKAQFFKRTLSGFLTLTLLASLLTAQMAALPSVDASSLELKDTVADRILYPYCSTIGGRDEGPGFSASVAWRSSSDSGVGYFQQSGSMVVGDWVRKQFTVADAGVYRVELVFKGASSGRGSVQNYLYPAADFPTGGSVTDAYKVGDNLNMSTTAYSELIREAGAGDNKILQTSTKAANNYLSYRLCDVELDAGDYALETKVTVAGLPVLVAVLLVPYEGSLGPKVVTLDEKTMELDVNTNPTGTVTATVDEDAEGWSAVAWASSDETVATVSGGATANNESTAIVTALKPGSARITATVTKGEEVSTASLTVTVQESATVAISPASLALDLTTAPTGAVTATVTEDWGVAEWTSSDESVATVPSSGNAVTVTAMGVGEATITAKVRKDDKESTATLHVTVQRTPPIRLSRSAVTINIGSEIKTVEIAAVLAEGYTLKGWESSHPAVATVPGGASNPVTITGVGEGTATITATAQRGEEPEETAILTVTVGNIADIGITYKSGQDKVLAVNAAKKTVTVAGGTKAEDLTSAVTALPGTDAITTAVMGKTGAEILASGDTLKVTREGVGSCDYTIIVMGDTSDTGIAAKVIEGFDFEFHGSNIGTIDNAEKEITLIDGMARYFTIEESIALGKTNGKAANRDDYTSTGQGGTSGEVAGRHRSLRSCAEIIGQLESVNGTAQTYQIKSATGSVKTTELPVTGDKLVVTAADGSTSEEYTITVETAALSGKLYVTSGPATVGTTGDLQLEYHAGQRTPEAEVVITLPAGVDATPDNTYVNVIGRGEIALSKFHLSRGAEVDGVFERPEMHRLLGRFSVNYAYQTLGTAEITGSAATGTTITFKGLDLRPNNGADLVLRIAGVQFHAAGEHNFSASLKTKALAITPTTGALQSLGGGSESAALNVVHQVSSLKRTVYNDTNFAARDSGAAEHDELKDLEYQAGVRAGNYTGFEMTWAAVVGATSITVEHATGTIAANGDVTLNDDWATAATLAADATSYTASGLAANTYHRYRLNITGGANAGISNEIGFYSGMLSATSVGVVSGTTNAAGAAHNKAQINKAIDWLNSIGGGTLLFPAAASSYQTGTVYLKSNVYLYLATGSFLESRGGSMDDPEHGWWCYRDYGSGTNSSEDPYANPDNFLSKQDDGHCFYQNAMFYARRESNMKIIGTGRIKGSGIPTGDGTVHSGATGARADDMIALKLCQNFELGGISNGLNLAFDPETVYLYHNGNPSGTVADSYPIWVDDSGVKQSTDVSNMLMLDDAGHFATLFGACDGINVHDVYYGKNQKAGRDVFDFMENNDVHVTNIMASGVSDDIVAPKSDCAMGFTRPVRGFWIRNIVGDTNCNNFQIGSETADDIQDIYIDNLVVLGANKCGFSISTNDGGYMKNINLNTGHTGTVLEDSGYFIRTRTPIFISISHRGRIIGAENRTVGGQRVITNVPIGRIEDITLNSVDITEVYSGTAYSSGYYPYSNQSFFTSVVVGYAMPTGTDDVTHSYTNDITAGYSNGYVGMPDGRLTGYVKNCTFNDVGILVKGGGAAANRGLTCNELNVGQYNSPDMGTRPSYGLYVTHAENFVMNGGRLGFEKNDDLYAIVLNDVKGATISDVQMDLGAGNGVTTGDNADGLIQVRNSENVNITGLQYAAGATPTARREKAISGNANAAQIIRAEDDRPLTPGLNTTGFGMLGATLVYPRDAVPGDEIFLQPKGDAMMVTAIDNGAGTVTVAHGTTVAELLAELESANGLAPVLTVTDATDTAKATGALVSGDKLVATVAEPALSKMYLITVTPIPDPVELFLVKQYASPVAVQTDFMVAYVDEPTGIIAFTVGAGETGAVTENRLTVENLCDKLREKNGVAVTFEVADRAGLPKLTGNIEIGDRITVCSAQPGVGLPKTYTAAMNVKMAHRATSPSTANVVNAWAGGAALSSDTDFGATSSTMPHTQVGGSSSKGVVTVTQPAAGGGDDWKIPAGSYYINVVAKVSHNASGTPPVSTARALAQMRVNGEAPAPVNPNLGAVGSNGESILAATPLYFAGGRFLHNDVTVDAQVTKRVFTVLDLVDSEGELIAYELADGGNVFVYEAQENGQVQLESITIIPVPTEETVAVADIRVDERSDVDKPVEYTVSLENMKKVMNVRILFEVDGDMLAAQGVDVLCDALTAVDGGSGIIRWSQKEDNIWQGDILLLYLGGEGGLSADAATDIFKVVYAAKQLGNATMKLTELRVTGLDADGNGVTLDSEIRTAEATTLVKEPDKVYSIYDLNKDEVVDARDLAMAQRYYMVGIGDANWEAAQVCDFNKDKLVDMLDLVDLFAHFTG